MLLLYLLLKGNPSGKHMRILLTHDFLLQFVDTFSVRGTHHALMKMRACTT